MYSSQEPLTCSDDGAPLSYKITSVLHPHSHPPSHDASKSLGPGLHPCRVNCQVCKHLMQFFKRDDNSSPLHIHHSVCCSSQNVVYGVRCEDCMMWYVGSTTQQLKARVKSHLSELRSARKGADVGRYAGFGSHGTWCEGGKVVDNSVTVLGVVQPLPKEDPKLHQKRLEEKEEFFIRKLGTLIPHGLNQRQGSQPNFMRQVHNEVVTDLSSEVGRLNEQLREVLNLYGSHTGAYKNYIRKLPGEPGLDDLPELLSPDEEFKKRKTPAAAMATARMLIRASKLEFAGVRLHGP